MFTLTEFPPDGKPYSMLQYRLFKALPQDGSTIGTKELVQARLELGTWDVKHPRNVISAVMDKLIDKVNYNNEAFIIRRSKDVGENRRDVLYWIEPRRPRESHRANATRAVRSSVLD